MMLQCENITSIFRDSGELQSRSKTNTYFAMEFVIMFGTMNTGVAVPWKGSADRSGPPTIAGRDGDSCVPTSMIHVLRAYYW
jgi:hypothetical protein